MLKEDLSNLMTPVLLLDYEKLENNIKRMAAKEESNEVELRPHIKTHKCIEIGMMQLKHGAKGITVSTLDEAEIFADAGINDITYAVPMTSNKINAALDIASKVNLRLLVDNYEIVSDLELYSERRGMALDVLLKVHCGYHRTGVDPRNPASIKLASKIANSRNLTFKGILTHAGHSYDATSIQQIKEIAIQEQTVMIDFSERLNKESSNLKPEVVSIGSTPTVELTERFMEGITEIRPGSYVFHDYTQVALGCCQVSDCALTTYSKIIGKYDGYLVTDAGATALSKDLGPTHIETTTGFGKIYSNYDKQELDPNLHIYSLSQEHGKVKILNPSDAQELRVNDALRILPNHSCLTANLHDCYYIVENDQVMDKWRVRRNRPITSPC
ncbi:DSD1 family PLP-dependent enzyme [Candidatus Thorarchaeota archaeon]|nr:MAG: DSD1 family PLP-dependent enzyme [Candidatus Thorarchaeota archaeon]